MNQQTENAVETTAISALAAASKTPFKTAFKVTVGIGLARLALFVLGVAAIIGLIALGKAVL